MNKIHYTRLIFGTMNTCRTHHTESNTMTLAQVTEALMAGTPVYYLDYKYRLMMNRGHIHIEHIDGVKYMLREADLKNCFIL